MRGGHIDVPVEWDALLKQLALKFTAAWKVLIHVPRKALASEAEGGEQPGRLADVPFDGMEAVGAVCEMRCPQILAGRQQVGHTFRYERSQRNLERTCGHKVVRLAVAVRMDIQG